MKSLDIIKRLLEICVAVVVVVVGGGGGGGGGDGGVRNYVILHIRKTAHDSTS